MASLHFKRVAMLVQILSIMTTKKSQGGFITNVLAIFSNNPFKARNYKQTASLLGIKDKASKDLLISVLYELKQQGTLKEVKPGKFILSPDKVPEVSAFKKYITGILDLKQTGKAWVITEELGHDVYISQNNTGKAFDGDKVKVYIFPKRSGRKTEGQVIEVLERSRTRFVGIYKASKDYGFVIPDNPGINVDLFIPAGNDLSAQTGDKVVVEMEEWPEHSRNPFGRITEVLGKPGNNNVEMQSILVEYNFPLSFKPETEKEAELIPFEIPETEIKSRRDFRDIFTITIDPADAKDFDDALSLRVLPDGTYEVGVHIADVSYYVKPGSPLDKEAFERGTSIYLVDRTIPMLPEKLSNHVCSLRQGEEKLCFSTVFILDDKAHIVSEWFGKTIIKSDRRYAYEEVQEMIEGADGDYKQNILILNRLATCLRNERYKRGSINFESQEVKFYLDENGKPTGVYIKEQKEAHRLIEDFMLLSNRRVAEFIGSKKGKEKSPTFVYRIHDAPSPEKLNTFAQFVSKLGYNLKISSRKNIASSLNKLLDDVAGKGEERMISGIAIRTMAKAVYSTHNIGHYGLSFPFYTHFTSPIRRYPDLMVHRLLFDYMHGAASVDEEMFESMCKHSSDMEKRAMEAERASIKYKQAEFLLDHVGEEFDALISGVSKWGIYAELIGNRCEGLIRMNALDDDFYYLDEDNYQIIGQRWGRTYRLGDAIKVKVRNVDMQKKQIDFDLISQGQPPVPSTIKKERKIKSSGRPQRHR